eukprot:gene1605-12730_t
MNGCHIFLTCNYIEGQGIGKSNREAENNAAKTIMFELLDCSCLNDELIQKDEEKVNQVIKKLKSKANIAAILSDVTTEMNLISMKLFSTKVEFVMHEGIDTEFHNCEAIIQYNNPEFDHVSNLVGKGYGRSKQLAKKNASTDLLNQFDELNILDKYLEYKNEKLEKENRVRNPLNVLNGSFYEVKIEYSGKEFGIGRQTTIVEAKKMASVDLIEKLPKKLYYDNPISIELRHKEYYDLFKHELKLFNVHLSKLKDEGLPEKLIQKLLIKSWTPGFKTKFDFTKNLAGFDSSGRILIGKGNGYIIPAYDPSNKITGGIIVYDRAQGAKSDWISREGGYPHYLPNSDQPLFVWNFSQEFPIYQIKKQYNFLSKPVRNGIIGVLAGARKSLKMSFEMGMPMIGAKSFEFHKSKESLIDYLQKLKKKNVLVFPDAEMKNQKLINFFYTLVIVVEAGFNCRTWWDQNLMNPRNIDKIEDTIKVEILSISQVWNKLITEERDHVKLKIQSITEFLSSEKYLKVINPHAQIK